MMLTRNRVRRIGWVAVLSAVACLMLLLAFRVNAVKSELKRTEDRIVALQRETIYLETEFQTRANQQQLKAWNDVEFGYVAPTAGQYLENERELASLGQPSGPGAPRPIRVAVAATDTAGAGALIPAMVSPLTGRPMASQADAADTSGADAQPKASAANEPATLGEKLATVRPAPNDEPEESDE